MSEFSITLPPEVWADVVKRAGTAPGAAAAWVADAVRERLAACAAREYMAARGAVGSREAFERVLAKAADLPPESSGEW